MAAKWVETTLRVRYAETDAMGVVYYGRYLEWFEVGRSEFMRVGGFPYSRLEAEGVFLPVVEVRCRYRRPARYDDLVTVRTAVTAVTPVRLTIVYEIRREGELLAEGSTEHAFVDAQGRPLNLQRTRPDLWQVLVAVVSGT